MGDPQDATPDRAEAADAPPPADDDAVERLRAELERLGDLPMAERAERFEAINAALTAELSRLDEV